MGTTNTPAADSTSQLNRDTHYMRLNSPVSVPNLLKLLAQELPEAVAIAAHGCKPLTYAGLFRQVQDVTRMLNSQGVGRNDRVAVVLRNGPEMAVTFLSIASAATCVPLNPASRQSEFEFYLRDVKAKALVIESGMDSAAIAAARSLGIRILELSPARQCEAGKFSLRGEIQRGASRDGLAQQDDVGLILYTSGTTARPKVVPLTHSNLMTSARNIAKALQLTRADRCLQVMALFHIHGLMAVLSSVAAGGSVVCTPSHDLRDFFVWMEEFDPSWYTASPTIHRAIIGEAKWHQEVIRRHPLRFIRSASSFLPTQLMSELELIFKAPVIEAYAMTEAAHQISSNPLPPRKRKVGSVGIAAGPEIAIMDNQGNLLPSGSVGEIVIRGDNVMKGYESNPAENKRSFAGAWFRTGDAGYLDVDGYLFISGRIKEIINRGGEKISPREVDEVILEHPAVAEAATFPIPHDLLGEEIAAAVRLHQDRSVGEQEIRQAVAERLADFKVPRSVVFVDDIPKSATGKVQRGILTKTLGERVRGGRSANVYARPRTPEESVLAVIWAQVLNVERVGIDDNFFDLGGHSLLALHMTAEVKRIFGKNIRAAALFQAPTLKQFAELLEQEQIVSPWSYLAPIQSRGGKKPFFWVLGYSSNPTLPRHLGLDQPLYGLEHQSQDGNAAVYTRIEDLADQYLKEVRTVQAKGPYLLGGYSFGAAVALEMAQQLLTRGEEVALLVAVAPTNLKKCKSLHKAIKARGEKQVATRGRSKIRRHLHDLVSLTLREKISYVWIRAREKLRQRGRTMWQHGRIIGKRAIIICFGIASEFYLFIGRSIPVSLRSWYMVGVNLRLLGRYEPQAYPGRIIVFKPVSDPYPSAWDRVAIHGLEVHEISGGDHHNVIHEPQLGVWAKRLKEYLDGADENARPPISVEQCQ